MFPAGLSKTKFQMVSHDPIFWMAERSTGTGDWFDVKTASTCTTELWDALKSFILDSLKIKVAPHPIIVSLDTLRWLGTVLARTERADFFFCQNLLFMAQAFRKWNNIGGSPCSIFQKMGMNVAIFDLVKYGVNGKTVTRLPFGSNFDNF